MSDPTVAQQKASLVSWWKNFTSKSPQSATPSKRSGDGLSKKGGSIFGVPLRESLRLASVAICMKGSDGHSYVYGYIPVIVAKCGVYLKENGTDVEGVFRVSGSNVRMKELQQLFDSPPRYGKDHTWAPGNGSVHDAASVFRRYLTMLPEPLIPCELWGSFRNVHTQQPFVLDSAIASYRLLITSLPDSFQHLLLYVLDLLAVFARKHHKTLMTASNLAMVFQPGLVVGPLELSLKRGTTTQLSGAALLENAKEQELEHKQSQEILEFLIKHQDHFVASVDPKKDRLAHPNRKTGGGSADTGGSGAAEASKSDGELEDAGHGIRRTRTEGAELGRRASEKSGSGSKRRTKKDQDLSSPGSSPRKGTSGGSLKRQRAATVAPATGLSTEEAVQAVRNAGREKATPIA